MKQKDGTSSPVPQGLVARIANGMKYIVGGDTAWFGPMQPMNPISQESVGRVTDYPVAYNLTTQPRSYEPVKFSDLRAVADGYDLLRLVIETRKDQMSKLSWNFKMKDPKAKPDARCEELTAFFAMPDKVNSFHTWLRMLLEDQMVLDAPTIYVRKTLGGQVYALEPLDGGTIKTLIDGQGRSPMPPQPAYQQILKGLPAIDYTREELVYFPRNPRTNKFYGYSPVEQVLMTVNIALRRQVSQLQYYTEGNVPEAIIALPAEWNSDQVAGFQKYWDGVLEGNTAQRRHAKFIPGGKETQVLPTKDSTLKDDYDEWLARVVCFAFSIAPTPFVKQMNRSVADNVKEMALEEGLAPMMIWVKDFVNTIVTRFWKYTDIEFDWEDIRETDPVQMAQVNQIYLNAGVLDADEVRADLGLDPLSEEQKANNAARFQPQVGNNSVFDGKTESHQNSAQPEDANKIIKKKSKVRLYATPHY